MSVTTVGAEFAPVIAGFQPDPSVCRVGEDYYLATSSFEYTPAVPLWHSRDLVTWTQIGNALTRPEQFTAARAGASGGIYAPTLRHHDGRFWLITTDVNDGGGQRLFWAERAEGPWSDAVLLPELTGIDPDIAWTDDGECLVTFCSFPEGVSGVWQARVDPQSGAALEPPRLVWPGTGMGHTEAPHLYRRHGWWYLMVAEGGTERGHAVSIARARSPRGPFQAAPHNPIYSHRSTAHPVQNTGHADLVERPDGSWAAVHLAVRPRGTTPGFHVNGREVFLCDVAWDGPWPEFTPSRARLLPQWEIDDTFATGHPRWVSPVERRETFARPTASGMRVEAASGGLYCRVQALRWRTVVDLTADAGSTAHVELRLDDRHRVGVVVRDGTARAIWTVGGVSVALGEAVPFEGSVEIAAVDPTTNGPDDVVLSAGGRSLGRIDGRYLSTEVAGGFTGRVVGVRVEHGAVALHRFRARGCDAEGTDAHAD
jgi:hypothetical protein